ncbi:MULTISPECIES: hypothetical protein [unclassified Micromonospora]|uniref:hypothetical protein n=1 Tax=unclassified Micromonospora TaxID=2617518 RepID=UPI0020B37788|nr:MULTISPECIES: hypothetical protein [unclassified Micromonospora]MDM4778240.1 hypothetical protein [Micromonospora sp. b486]
MSRATAGQEELDAADALLAVDPDPDDEDEPDEEDVDDDEESDDEDEDSDLAGLLVVEVPLSEPDERESVR